MSALISELPRSIEELVLSSSWFGDMHIVGLADRLPNLQMLELWRCRASADGLTKLAMSLQSLLQFDTDMMLGAHNEQILLKHPSLQRVCCCLDPKCGHRKSRVENIKFIAADGIYSIAILRGDGEGYRADLFYYWTQNTFTTKCSLIETNV